MNLLIIIGLAGAIGTGKSWTMVSQAVEYANERRKNLVFNFEISVPALYRYASLPRWFDSPLSGLYLLGHRFTRGLAPVLDRLDRIHPALALPLALPYHLIRAFLSIMGAGSFTPRYPWIQHLCRTGGIFCLPAPEKLEALLIPESVTCLDEAGILLNARDFATTSKRLLADLAQSRHDGCDLFWAAQFEEQVDKQVRLLTQYWIHCDSMSIYDKKMRRPKLFWKRIYWFRAADYFQWLYNPRDRSSHFKARFSYGFKYLGGPMCFSDKYLFNVFNSFGKPGSTKAPGFAVSRHRCCLPKDYYFNRLQGYRPECDPFTKRYEPIYGYYRKTFAPVVSTAPKKNELVRQALAVARSQKIRAPYFGGMSENAITNWLRENS